MATTYNTFPDLVYDGGRMAAVQWHGNDPTAAVAATLQQIPDAVILLVRTDSERLQGHGPGGLAA